MMRRKPRPSQLLLVLFVLLLSSTTGCSSARDEFLWQLGVILFAVYLFVLTMVVVMPKLHRQAWFQRFAEAIRIPTLVVASAACIIGTAAFVMGLTRLGEDFGPRKLLFLMGVILMILGVNLFLWVCATTPEEKTLRAKVVSLSVSFGVGLLYVMLGAQLINK